MDIYGNIDTAKLEKELHSSLQADVKYKQTDNMKKKAIKVAASYDEFKAMVACAHLKTLQRSEIDSLKDFRKGWKKDRSTTRKDDTLILGQEVIMNARDTTALMCDVEKIKKPKSPLELERDWRRLPDDEAKAKYLLQVGKKRIVSLIEQDGNGELLEGLLSVIVSTAVPTTIPTDAADAAATTATTPTDAAADIALVDAEQSSSSVEVEMETLTLSTATTAATTTADVAAVSAISDHNEAKSIELRQSKTEIDSDAVPEVENEGVAWSKNKQLSWMKSFSGMKNFRLTIQFVDASLRSRIIEWLRAEGGVDSQNLIALY